jgi:hypothetical protein
MFTSRLSANCKPFFFFFFLSLCPGSEGVASLFFTMTVCKALALSLPPQNHPCFVMVQLTRQNLNCEVGQKLSTLGIVL